MADQKPTLCVVGNETVTNCYQLKMLAPDGKMRLTDVADIQGQTKAVRKALAERLLGEMNKTNAQKAMVKDSLTRAFDELRSGKVHHDARKLFTE